MKKYQRIILVVVLLIIVFLTGCAEDNTKSISDRFIGTWKTNDGLTFIFNQNKTCSMEGWASGQGTWELYGDKINVTLDFTGGKNYMSYSYEFSNNYETLTLTDAGGNSRDYTKQEA